MGLTGLRPVTQYGPGCQPRNWAFPWSARVRLSLGHRGSTSLAHRGSTSLGHWRCTPLGRKGRTFLEVQGL